MTAWLATTLAVHRGSFVGAMTSSSSVSGEAAKVPAVRLLR